MMVMDPVGAVVVPRMLPVVTNETGTPAPMVPEGVDDKAKLRIA